MNQEQECNMNTQRIVGIVLLVVGLILLSVGMNASHSLADQVSNTFTGRFTQATTWYIVGGIASALLGVLMVLVDLRRKTA
jgi:drug/metabolite transporter (DMT)-like permease